MNPIVVIFVSLTVATVSCLGQPPVEAQEHSQQLKAELVSVEKIWDESPHNAFTDLVRWNGAFYCAFREGQGHAGDRGWLRILHSESGEKWTPIAKIQHESFDLRDAALCELPDGRLMVLGGAQSQIDGTRRTGTFVCFSEDGESFSKPKMVVDPGRWLWRVTVFENAAYGVTYGAPDRRDAVGLLKTSNGIDYETITDTLFEDGEYPTEARIRFAQDATAICLLRRDGRTKNSAMLGQSKPPYREWTWSDLGKRLGGPNFLQLPTGQWIAVGRAYDDRQRTEVFALDVEKGALTSLLTLPSGGDTSYPGLVWHDDLLWVSYYSSHEDKTNIYLAKISINDADDDPSQEQSKSAAYEIGHRRELFVDDFLVEDTQGIRHRLHRPIEAETSLDFDRPWEGAFCGYVTVLDDGERKRMYYRGLPASGADGSDREVTCYAESHDGVTWTKPNLGIYSYDGSKDNNIVLMGETPASHNFSPFIDTNPNCSAEAKFKALGGTSAGLIGFKSPDGLHWTRVKQSPVFTDGVFDSQNVAFWSESESCYVCYFRTWTKANYGGFRSVSRTTSKDFITWTKPVEMKFGDRPYEHLYTNQTQPYFRAPHLYLGIAARFMPGRQVLSPEQAGRIGVDPKYFGDISDAVLLTSRGGASYDRSFMESLIRPGIGLENWVSRTNYPACGIIPTSDHEISAYVQKNYGQPTAHLKRYRFRTDGFASLEADYAGGEWRSRPLHIADATGELLLSINASTSAAGSIQVEIQDESGAPLPGFELSQSKPMIGDSIDRTMEWENGPSLTSIAGRVVRLRFVMRDANLYSLQFHSPNTETTKLDSSKPKP